MTPATINGRKNCPGCRYWWFDRQRSGCSKDQKRSTNTTAQLYETYRPKEKCQDFKALIV